MFKLGPVQSWLEAAPAPVVTPAPVDSGYVGVTFGPTPIEIGGKVNVQLLPAVTPTDITPISVRAVYVPTANLPPVEQQTPEWFLGSGFPSGSTAASPTPFAIQVSPAPTAATQYTVQTVIEYPDPTPAPAKPAGT